MKNLFCMLLLSFKCFAQEEPLYKNIVYAEGLGNAVIYSINYERLVHKGDGFQNYIRVGFSLYTDSLKYRSPKKLNLDYIIPLMFIHQRGVKQLKFEYGIGLFTNFGRPANLLFGTGNDPYGFGLTGSLGGRYISKKTGLFLKLCYTPFYDFMDKGESLWFFVGASVGYAFKVKTKPTLPNYDNGIPNNIIRYPIEQDTISKKKKETGVRLPNGKVIYPAVRKKVTYPDSTKKTYYSLLLDVPTSRIGGGYGIGIEYYHNITKKIAFTSSFTTEIGTLGSDLADVIKIFYGQNHIYPHFVFAACLQPFHLLIGQKRLRFETGLSVSYINYYVNHPPSYFGINYRFQYNIYVGVRYNFKKIPFHAHLAYVPYIDDLHYLKAPSYVWFNPFGFEFGIGYILHKSQAAQKRSAIKKQVEEGH